ncbi:DUF4998 domain-containing protein [uncultured Chitinophaga sp.]|uniref:DUF4998 domain-containing protein n=1 Tax=uncultured Chitinophaga sp. TaxID=339340 RepID=UPI0025E2E29D|nr:DUF4998 domain-containing protein [uncultured Chitinophaga sp.]
MKKLIIKQLGVALLCAVTLAACSKWDDYKQYTANGETLYTGKLDSAKVFSGSERVRLKGLLVADPKISKVRVSWNDGADSLVFAVDKAGSRTFDQTFAVNEGVKSFRINTFDDKGNTSVPVNVIGTSYGSAYKRKLVNRPVVSSVFASNKTTITWDLMDFSIGAQYTEIEYIVSGVTLSVKTPVSQATTVLDGFNTTSAKFRYRTVFRPDTTCIDLFYTEFVER